MKKHTKGPWRYQNDILSHEGQPIVLGLTGNEARPVAIVAGVLSPDDPEHIQDEIIANAYLIAAAPTLLNVLERYMAQCEAVSPMEAFVLFNDMKKAIAMAKGET